MKIQFQSMYFYPSIGGIENYMYNTSKELLKLGHDPTVLCSKHTPSLKVKDNIDGINIIRHPLYSLPKIPLSPLTPFYYAKKLENYLKNINMDYDIVWARYFFESYASSKTFKDNIPIVFIQAVIASSLEKISFISNKNILDQLYFKSISKQYNFIESYAVENCDKIITLSKIRMLEIRDHYELDKKKFEVVPSGVNIDVFKPSEKDYKLLNELNIPYNCKIILSVCRLSKEKNLKLLINAFSKIKNNNLFLIIVGDGIDRKNLEKQAITLQINDKIRFTGFRTDTNRFYSIADVFVLPSIYEGFGQVYLEAMASGVPCIGLEPDYPNIIVASDEIIKAGYNGYLVDPYSINDLIEKIEKVLFDDISNNLGYNARKICEKEYTWEQITNSLLKISKKLTK